MMHARGMTLVVLLVTLACLVGTVFAQSWDPVLPMTSARYLHTATLLADGSVLVAGGVGAGAYLSTTERYDPAAGPWTPAAPMAGSRFLHTATRLADGRVLVAGGLGAEGFLASAEIYDPATGLWSAATSMADARVSHTATRLADGRVLVAGGWDGAMPRASVERFRPATTPPEPPPLTCDGALPSVSALWPPLLQMVPVSILGVSFTATDAHGSSCQGAVTVGVPRSRWSGPAVDDGQQYDSTEAGPAAAEPVPMRPS